VQPVPGDIVVLWRRPELISVGQRQGLLKRLTSALPETIDANAIPPAVILVETSNPARTYVVPLDQVMAVHKLVGIVDEGGAEPDIGELVIEARRRVVR
jgi:hypothetical protein